MIDWPHALVRLVAELVIGILNAFAAAIVIALALDEDGPGNF